METRPSPRTYARIAVAIVIAAVIISATLLSYSAFESTITKTETTTVVDTCVQGSTTNEYSASNSTADCSLGVTLGIQAYQVITSGETLAVSVTLSNDVASARDVNYTGFPALQHGIDPSSPAWYDYVLPLGPACGYPSTSTFEPAFLAVYNASGFPMQLSDLPMPMLSCVSNGAQSHFFSASQTLNESENVEQYWTSSDANEPWFNATSHIFPAGNYTAVAFDLWGQLAELSFTVLPQSFDYLTTACYYGSDGTEAAGPCFASAGAFIFDCKASAATSQGCTENITSSLDAHLAYTVNILYPFTNQTTEQINKTGPSPVNCLLMDLSPAQDTMSQDYAYCLPIGPNSFVVGEQAVVPLA